MFSLLCLDDQVLCFASIAQWSNRARLETSTIFLFLQFTASLSSATIGQQPSLWRSKLQASRARVTAAHLAKKAANGFRSTTAERGEWLRLPGAHRGLRPRPDTSGRTDERCNRGAATLIRAQGRNRAGIELLGQIYVVEALWSWAACPFPNRGRTESTQRRLPVRFQHWRHSLDRVLETILSLWL